MIGRESHIQHQQGTEQQLCPIRNSVQIPSDDWAASAGRVPVGVVVPCIHSESNIWIVLVGPGSECGSCSCDQLSQTGTQRRLVCEVQLLGKNVVSRLIRNCSKGLVFCAVEHV